MVLQLLVMIYKYWNSIQLTRLYSYDGIQFPPEWDLFEVIYTVGYSCYVTKLIPNISTGRAHAHTWYCVQCSIILNWINVNCRHAVAQLVKTLSYMLEGHKFDSWGCHWNFWYIPSDRNMFLESPGALFWQPYYLHLPIVSKFGILNLLEPSGPAISLYRDCCICSLCTVSLLRRLIICSFID